MEYWGWRPLVCCIFISVIVFGCTDEAPSTLEPSEFPPMTLIVLTPGLSPTRSPVLPSVNTASPQITVSMTITSDLYPLNSDIQPPSCYPTPQNSIICLGEILNTRNEPIGQVSLWAEMLDEHGLTLQEQQVFVLQQTIYPGETAPYRVLFHGENVIDEFGGVRMSLQRVTSILITPPEIELEHLNGTLLDEQYIFSADVMNQGDAPLDMVRLVVTLYDTENHIVGFRMVELGEFAVHARRSVEVAILPLIKSDALRYEVHIEAE